MRYILIIYFILSSTLLVAQTNIDNAFTFKVKKATDTINEDGLYLYLAIDSSNSEKYITKEPGQGEISVNNLTKAHIIAYYKTSNKYIRVDSLIYTIYLVKDDSVVFAKSFNNIYFKKTRMFELIITASSFNVEGFVINSRSGSYIRQKELSIALKYKEFVISIDKILLSNKGSVKIIETPNIVNKKTLFDKQTNEKIAEGAVFNIN